MPKNRPNTPLEFAEMLERKKSVWKRNGGTAASPAARRHFRDLVRRSIRAFRTRFGDAELPKFASAAEAGSAWIGTPFVDAKIVIAPQAPSGDGGMPDAADARRDLRKRLRNTVVGSGPFELVNARNARSAYGEVFVARSTRTDRTGIRGIFFEEIGAAVIPGLSAGQVAELEAQGAMVLDNEFIELGDPTAPKPDGGSAASWHLDAIDVQAARSRGLTGKGITIGVLDTGIDPYHPEFAGKGIEFCEFDLFGLAKPTKAMDFQWHGTHVSALAAGSTVGVARDASLAVAAVLTTKSNGKMVGTTAQLLGGLNWLAGAAGRNGSDVDIINVSLGGPDTSFEYLPAFLQRHLEGRLIVAAIGNDGAKGEGNHLSPARFDFVVGVGACDDAYAVASFSAWGETHGAPLEPSHKPDLVAPGVAVRSALPQGAYGLKDGTSMACPLVSGAAALLIENDENMRRNPQLLKQALLKLTCVLPATPQNADIRRGGRGRLDLSLLS